MLWARPLAWPALVEEGKDGSGDGGDAVDDDEAGGGAGMGDNDNEEDTMKDDNDDCDESTGDSRDAREMFEQFELYVKVCKTLYGISDADIYSQGVLYVRQHNWHRFRQAK